MSSPYKLVRRVDNLEFRMDALEKSHHHIIDEIRPLREAVSAFSFVQKAATFLVLAAAAIEAYAHLAK